MIPRLNHCITIGNRFWSNFVDLKLINSGTVIVPQDCQLFLLLERFSYIRLLCQKSLALSCRSKVLNHG